jgi:hypothetical protein
VIADSVQLARSILNAVIRNAEDACRYLITVGSNSAEVSQNLDIAIRGERAANELQRQQRIAELQRELQAKLDLAEQIERGAADTSAAGGNDPLSRGIAQIGATVQQNKAQSLRQEASSIQAELQQLTGQDYQVEIAASQERSANYKPQGNLINQTMNAQIGQIAAAAQQTANQRAEAQRTAPVQIINPVTLAPVSSSSTAPPASNLGASASYSGPYSDWVHKLLSRVGSWSCPSSMSATDGRPPQVQTDSISFRDQYVKAAVLDAWAAECYTRQEHDNEAQTKAQDMMQNLKAAEALCSGNPPCQSGPTAGIYHCGELQPGARIVPQCDGSATAYAYYVAGASSVDQQLNVTIFTTSLQIPYEPDEAANSPLDMDRRVDTVLSNSARALASGLGPVHSGFGTVVIGPKQKADLQIESAMNDLYNKYIGYHDPYNTYLIFLVDATSGAVIRRLQVNKAPKPSAPTGAGAAR